MIQIVIVIVKNFTNISNICLLYFASGFREVSSGELLKFNSSSTNSKFYIKQAQCARSLKSEKVVETF